MNIYYRYRISSRNLETRSEVISQHVRFILGGYDDYQTIRWDVKNKVYYGASESGKDGEVSGY